MTRKTWDYSDLRSGEGKPYMLEFLPYLETPDGRRASETIGYLVSSEAPKKAAKKRASTKKSAKRSSKRSSKFWKDVDFDNRKPRE